MSDVKEKQENHGFIADVIKPEDYVFGGSKVPMIPIQADGQWGDFLPPHEMQKRNGLETMNCTVYGNINLVEILLNKLFNIKRDYSERYIGVLSETSRSGNSPHKVLEVIRKEAGLILDEGLPFSDDIDKWEEYYKPNPMTSNFKDEGAKWLSKYILKHEWVFTGGTIEEKQELLRQALMCSPIGVSVYAWYQKDGIYYKLQGQRDNHWCTLYGYVEGKYWLIFDHYNDTHKKLDWAYDFGFAKRLYLKKKESAGESGTVYEGNVVTRFLLKWLDLLANIFIAKK